MQFAITQKENCERKIAALESENERLRKEVAALSNKNSELYNKDIVGKLTKAIEQKEDINELRRKINELLQEVNKGLALLVLIQDRDRDDERGDD
jgi:polyhydroxyalkanoate synthesis regulator phasin